MRHLSFGHIANTRSWLSLQLEKWNWNRFWLSFKPTYVGTKYSISIGLPFITIIGHIRYKKIPFTP